MTVTVFLLQDNDYKTMMISTQPIRIYVILALVALGLLLATPKRPVHLDQPNKHKRLIQSGSSRLLSKENQHH